MCAASFLLLGFAMATSQVLEWSLLYHQLRLILPTPWIHRF
jgi:hypothetical protein